MAITRSKPRPGDWELRRDGVQISAHPSWLEASRAAGERLAEAGAVLALYAWEAGCAPYYGLHNKPPSMTVEYAERDGRQRKLEVAQWRAFRLSADAFFD
ncbi:MAG TPA: hypothetical protein VKQ70_00640 [Caulobacteraceae bacterium]|nr:hypothetical protein [Caulobacteraceae bacterium]